MAGGRTARPCLTGDVGARRIILRRRLGVAYHGLGGWLAGFSKSNRAADARASLVRQFVGVPGAHLSELSPDVLIAANERPGDLHRDPADQILAATARAFRYRLMTRDRPLLAYAAAGHMQAIAC